MNHKSALLTVFLLANTLFIAISSTVNETKEGIQEVDRKLNDLTTAKADLELTNVADKTTSKPELKLIRVGLVNAVHNQESGSSSQAEIDSCKAVCDKTYSLHTYPKADNLAACQRGCRFYELISALSLESTNTDEKSAVNHDLTTKKSCLTACSESYKNESENDACTLGCNSQVAKPKSSTIPTTSVQLDSSKMVNDESVKSEKPIIADEKPLLTGNESGLKSEDSKKDDVLIPNEEEKPTLIINSMPSPFALMKNLLDSLMERGRAMMDRGDGDGSSVMTVQRSSLFITRQGDGDDAETRVVVVHSQPEVIVSGQSPLQSPFNLPSIFKSFNQDSESNQNQLTVGDKTTSDYRVPQQQPPRLFANSPLWNDHHLFMGSAFLGDQDDAPSMKEIDPDKTYSASTSKTSWISCFGYNSGVPRWLLAAVLLLAIMALAWICCATTATAPEQHIRRQIGAGSDLQYLRLNDEPSCKLVIDDKSMLVLSDGALVSDIPANDERPPSYDDLNPQQLLKPEEETSPLPEKPKEPTNNTEPIV